MRKIFYWLRFYLLIPHLVYFVTENTLSFTLFGRAGTEREAKEGGKIQFLLTTR